MKCICKRFFLIFVVLAAGCQLHCRDFFAAARQVKKLQLAGQKLTSVDAESVVNFQKNNDDKTNPQLMWQKIKKIPVLMDSTLMPQIESMVQSALANAQSSDQLTLVNDVLELEQQAKDLHEQIMKFIKRFEQIYSSDAERAQELYVIIIHDLTILRSIRKHMSEIAANFNKIRS